MDVRGSFTVNDNTISVIADVMPYIDADARIYISVNEKETHGNVGSNGETSFHHVFMKMLPDAQGSTVNFTSCELQRLEFTQDMSGTHVEEMSDLEVSIWVQNHSSKEVFNSHFAYEYTEVHPYPVENLTVSGASRGLLTASWNAPTNGNPNGYNVYVNGVLVAENITDTQYSFEGQPDEFYVVGVVALYENDMTSVKVLATASSTMQDLGLIINGSEQAMLNPEQATAQLYVINANDNTHADITILSVEEENPEGVQYLTITCEDLPYVLAYNAVFTINIEPNNPGEGRSIAETKVVVTSDAGTAEFLIEVDGELLKVTELTSETKLYPNPANNNICIEATNSIESVTVYDMMGALVEIVPANSRTINVNTANLNNGVYFFSIRQNDGSVCNQRVVISH
jgi:hypothetical protein